MSVIANNTVVQAESKSFATEYSMADVRALKDTSKKYAVHAEFEILEEVNFFKSTWTLLYLKAQIKAKRNDMMPMIRNKNTTDGYAI